MSISPLFYPSPSQIMSPFPHLFLICPFLSFSLFYFYPPLCFSSPSFRQFPLLSLSPSHRKSPSFSPSKSPLLFPYLGNHGGCWQQQDFGEGDPISPPIVNPGAAPGPTTHLWVLQPCFSWCSPPLQLCPEGLLASSTTISGKVSELSAHVQTQLYSGGGWI